MNTSKIQFILKKKVPKCYVIQLFLIYLNSSNQILVVFKSYTISS